MPLIIRGYHNAATLFLLAGLIAGAVGCGITAKGNKVVKECILPDDQVSTLSGRWRVTPISVAFHQGDFAPDEVRDITAAAETWNTFYAASLNMAAIDFGGDPNNPRVSSAPRPGALCTQGILQGNQFVGSVVIYKMGSWPYPSLPDAIALTSFCPSGTSGSLPTIYMAMMEVNYQNFFVQGRKLPDLQSIFVHEFGHLAGLNHSCERTNKTGTPNCTSASLNPDYVSAVMFPIFAFDGSGLGEVKRSLASNDQGRANCLYQDLVPK